MKSNPKQNLIFTDIKEYAAILVIKLLIAVAVFAFSAAIADVVSYYVNRADSWMRDSSQTISRNIIDLYR